MSKLENDCIAILDYAAGIEPRCPERAGKWISIVEIAEERCIPDSTIRNIVAIAKAGIFIKYDGINTSIHQDVFDKIAKKYRFDYRIKKMRGKDNRISWHISAVKLNYWE
jgi:hypothetical protein